MTVDVRDIDRSGKTLILMGGWTAEAEVSRNSAAACLKSALKIGWDAECLEVTRHLAADLIAAKPARVFNALHGQMGEDGNVQGLLNLMEIPYTHSGLLASAIAMDKPATKNALRHLGIRFPDDLDFTINDDDIHVDHDGPVVIKPRNDGSSIGVVITSSADEIPSYSTWPEGTDLMAEPMIPGRELTVAVLEGEPLTVTEITQGNAFYDYQAKYETGGSQHQLPADIPDDIFDQVMLWSSLAHRGLGCRGVSRSDFRWNDRSGEVFMLEINTQPGMTATSLVPEQAAYLGTSMDELVDQLLEVAQCD
ncbi:MAG: D-alanine--D-alanine ligase [Alphaproteobacteria bacterium]|nr:D-alanine--D-alanine ligase [Alphaproteobacteria bacterium]